MTPEQIQNLLSRTMTGIRATDELPISAAVWREAHEHHDAHRWLHATLCHRPGIVYGLEVLPSRSRPHRITVAPGMAIDDAGNAILVSEPVSFDLIQTRTVYIVLSFQRAMDRDSAIPLKNNSVVYFREVEGHEIRECSDPPQSPQIELARLYRSEVEHPVFTAVHAESPGPDEINLLFRTMTFPFCRGEVSVGELTYAAETPGAVWNRNTPGLIYLLREANQQGLHAAYAGPFDLRSLSGQSSAIAPTLLYIAGSGSFKPFAPAAVAGLQRFLDAGGTLLGEALRGDEGGGFEASFRELLRGVRQDTAPMPADHALLTALHIFAEPPAGGIFSGRIEVSADDSILFSAFDYGAAWRGDLAPPADDASAAPGTSRERIRAAQEFGVNLLTYAAQRQRRRYLDRLLD